MPKPGMLQAITVHSQASLPPTNALIPESQLVHTSLINTSMLVPFIPSTSHHHFVNEKTGSDEIVATVYLRERQLILSVVSRGSKIFSVAFPD